MFFNGFSMDFHVFPCYFNDFVMVFNGFACFSNGFGLKRVGSGLDDVPGECVSSSSGSAAGCMTREGDLCRAQAGRQRAR